MKSDIKSSSLNKEGRDRVEWAYRDMPVLDEINKVFMQKKPLKNIFGDINKISNKLKLNINDRPQNLTAHTYFQICKEYENLFF